MEFDYGMMVDAIKEGMKPDEDESPRGPATMIAIEPFDAETIEDVKCRVVGIAPDENGVLVFVTLKTDAADGSIYPFLEDAVWPVTAAAG